MVMESWMQLHQRSLSAEHLLILMCNCDCHTPSWLERAGYSWLVTSESKKGLINKTTLDRLYTGSDWDDCTLLYGT